MKIQSLITVLFFALCGSPSWAEDTTSPKTEKNDAQAKKTKRSPSKTKEKRKLAKQRGHCEVSGKHSSKIKSKKA